MPWWIWLIFGSVVYITGWVLFVALAMKYEDRPAGLDGKGKSLRSQAEEDVKVAMGAGLLWPFLLIFGGPILLVMGLHKHITKKVLARWQRELEQGGK